MVYSTKHHWRNSTKSEKLVPHMGIVVMVTIPPIGEIWSFHQETSDHTCDGFHQLTTQTTTSKQLDNSTKKQYYTVMVNNSTNNNTQTTTI